MVEGVNHDDGYVMVEDELLSIAKIFTQHLHHAEYVRMKEAAKKRDQSAMVERPTDPRTKMSEQTTKTKAAEARTQMLKVNETSRSGTKGQHLQDGSETEDEDDHDNDPWVGTTLHALMSNVRPSRPSLAGIADNKSGVRLAAGFTANIPYPKNTTVDR